MDELRSRHICLLSSLLLACMLTVACSRSMTEDLSGPSSVTIIENKGSDTIVNLALAWAESYHDSHPEVRISVTGGGSGTGIAALINASVDIANASRKIKLEERTRAEANGVLPVEFVIALDRPHEYENEYYLPANRACQADSEQNQRTACVTAFWSAT